MPDFTLTSGHVVTLDSDGISSVVYQGQQICTGNVQLIDGGWFYNAFENRTYVPTITSKYASATPDGQVVTHCYTGTLHGGTLHATVIYNYTVSGDDIHIDATVTNNSTIAFSNPAFGSAGFLWYSWPAAQASSNLLGYDASHTQNNASVNKIILAYPGSDIQYAATYVITVGANSVPINFCTWSRDNPFDRFITLAHGSPYRLTNIFFNSIPPNGASKFKFSYRFSDSTDWKVLMQGYKDYLRATAPIQYNTDARPWSKFTSINSSYIRSDNPYGYNDGNGSSVYRRFDLPEGVTDYISRQVAPMVDTNYAGMMFWQPQGISPRGVQYRPDINVWPAGSVANISPLFDGFTSAGLKVGLQTRPGVTVTSLSDTSDGLIAVLPYKGSWDDLSGRLTWATGKGVTAFYMDSFVTRYDDHQLLKLMRTQLGPNIQLFSEQNTACSMALAGMYNEFTYTSGSYVFSKSFPCLTWLYPEGDRFMNFTSAPPPGGYSDLYDYMFTNKLSAVVEDYRAWAGSSENVILKALIPQYIDGSNQWM